MAYFRCGGGGIPSSIKTDMNAVLNKKFGTQSENYPPTEWADDVNLMGLLPIRTASGTIAHFSDGADDVPLKSLTAQIVPIQEGTGDPSPSNPRPISGTDELTLTQTGANLLDGEKTADAFVETVSTPTNTYKGEDTDGKFLSFFGSYAINQKTFFSIPFKANTQYSVILKMKKDNNSNASNLAFVYTDGTRVQLTAPTTPTPNEVFTFVATSSSTKTLASIDGFYASGRSFLYYEESGVFEGVLTTADFEPYKSETHTIDLGQEIMGGTADVVGGVGSKTSGFAVYDGSEEWFEQSGTFRVPAPQDGYYDTGLTVCIDNCNLFNPSLSGNNTIRRGLANLVITTNSFSSLADFKASLSTTPLQIAYPLTTPTEYTFTGQPTRSLLGVNNVWTDSGEVLDVDYRADMNLLIASLEGNRGLQMMRATPTEENDEQEATENEDER